MSAISVFLYANLWGSRPTPHFSDNLSLFLRSNQAINSGILMRMRRRAGANRLIENELIVFYVVIIMVIGLNVLRRTICHAARTDSELFWSGEIARGAPCLGKRGLNDIISIGELLF